MFPVYGSGESNSFFAILCREYLDLYAHEISMQQQRELTETEIKKFNSALEALKIHRPIQYITGFSEFCRLRFKVNENTLIPRPETEELVHWIRNRYNPAAALNILDIGTGSGCIAVSLAKYFSNAKVYAVDFSKGALECASYNASQNGVDVTFVQSDILKVDSLSDLIPETGFDIIVSNPPYVRELEKAHMQKNVLDYEPVTALFVSDTDPLLFYRKIAGLAVEGLKQGGELYFEINQYLSDETIDLLVKTGFNLVEAKKDFFDNFRMVKGEK